MEDAQKLAQGLQQKAEEESNDRYASKELEDAARAITVLVEPFVAHANELLAKPKERVARCVCVCVCVCVGLCEGLCCCCAGCQSERGRQKGFEGDMRAVLVSVCVYWLLNTIARTF